MALKVDLFLPKVRAHGVACVVRHLKAVASPVGGPVGPGQLCTFERCSMCGICSAGTRLSLAIIMAFAGVVLLISE